MCAHIECYSDCSRRGIHLVEPFMYVPFVKVCTLYVLVHTVFVRLHTRFVISAHTFFVNCIYILKLPIHHWLEGHIQDSKGQMICSPADAHANGFAQWENPPPSMGKLQRTPMYIHAPCTCKINRNVVQKETLKNIIWPY